jgi:hypothetical protein
MKKIIVTLVGIFAFGSINAQDIKSKKGELYLPEKGDWAIGFNADGIFEYVGNAFNAENFNNAPSVNFIRNNTFVGKMFIANNQAYRVVANLGIVGGTTTTPVIAGAGSPSVTTTTTKVSNPGFDLTIGLGKEWRRGKTRLQGFYGADAVLNINSSKNRTEVSAVTETTAPGPPIAVTTTTLNTETVSKNGLGLGIGVVGFIGGEYFIFPKMSIGAQYSWGLNVGIQGKSNVETSVSGTGIPSTTKDVDGANSSRFGLGNVGIGTGSLNLTLHF